MRSKSFKGGTEARKSRLSADPVCEFYTSHPYPPPVENLDRARDVWQDENVHRAEYHLLWRGLMTNHDVVVHRSDMNNDGLKVRFDDEHYLRYVPIRLPWTMCVEEGLPAGTAGV